MPSNAAQFFADLSYNRLIVWSGDPRTYHSADTKVLSYSLQDTGHVQYHGMDVLPEILEDIKKQWQALHATPLGHIDYLSITPHDILSLQTHAATEIRHNAVALYEIDELCDSAQCIGLPEGYVLKQVEPLWYHIDQYVRVKDPLGMRGTRLEGHFHLLATQALPLDHMASMFKKSGMTVGHYVMRPMLMPYEPWGKKDHSGQKIMVYLEQHACILAVLDKNTCIFASTHIMGESLMDKDLATCLGISLEEAHKIRLRIPALLENKVMRRHSNGLDIPLMMQVLQARSVEMAQELYQSVSGHIKWDVPLRIEIRSLGMKYYWQNVLSAYFPQADVEFSVFDAEEKNDIIGALVDYTLASEAKMYGVKKGWRYWWKQCQKWIEYHL